MKRKKKKKVKKKKKTGGGRSPPPGALGRCGILQTMENYTYRIILELDEGGYHAYVPALRGCHTWGKTIAEARKMVRDAIDVYLRSLIADGEPVPTDSGFELFETVQAPKGKRVLVHA